MMKNTYHLKKIIEWILNEIIILSIFSNELTKDYDSFC